MFVSVFMSVSMSRKGDLMSRVASGARMRVTRASCRHVSMVVVCFISRTNYQPARLWHQIYRGDEIRARRHGHVS